MGYEPMRLWAAGIVYTYIGLQLLNWVMGLHWLSEFALPITMLTGVSLAIASQPSPPDTDPTTSDAGVRTSPEPISDIGAAPISENTTNTAESSISFTIRKDNYPKS